MYYNAKNIASVYEYHVKQAFDILIPRGWFVPIVEYSATINIDFIRDIDMQTYKRIVELKKSMISAYIDVGLFGKLSDRASMDMSTNMIKLCI